MSDVLAECVQDLPDVHIAMEAGGTHTALNRTCTVPVSDGRLDLRSASAADKPLVDAIRGTQRPDPG
ncbi:hypothetical protein [Streptomyces sp. NPDC005795]|uniref:hypothetical protein n=1 Tax=Streptomyces sp. NPDC005795 TaxID=3154677 RepID=UPI0033D7ACE1